jgi:hypothetical protein
MKKQPATRPSVSMASPLIHLAIGTLLVSPVLAQPCTPAPSGLVGWWSGDGNGIDLAGTNSVSLSRGATYGSGLVGRAFSFSGGPDVVQSAVGSRLASLQNTFTVEFWALPAVDRLSTREQSGGSNGIGGQRYAITPEWGGQAAAGVGVSVGRNGVSVFEHGDAYMPSVVVYDAVISGWTHIAVVYQNRLPSLYINGVLARTGLTGSRSVVYPSILFGNVPDAPQYGPYVGLLDEVCVYNRALSATEIQAIHQAGNGGKCGKPAYTIALYPNSFPDLYAGLTISGLQGHSYGVQCTTNLFNPGSWIGVTNLTLAESPLVWHASERATGAQKYYRVLHGPVPVP